MLLLTELVPGVICIRDTALNQSHPHSLALGEGDVQSLPAYAHNITATAGAAEAADAGTGTARGAAVALGTESPAAAGAYAEATANAAAVAAAAGAVACPTPLNSSHQLSYPFSTEGSGIAGIRDPSTLVLELSDPGKWVWRQALPQPGAIMPTAPCSQPQASPAPTPTPTCAHADDGNETARPPPATSSSVASTMSAVASATGALGKNALARLVWAARRAMVGVVASMEERWLQQHYQLRQPPQQHQVRQKPQQPQQQAQQQQQQAQQQQQQQQQEQLQTQGQMQGQSLQQHVHHQAQQAQQQQHRMASMYESQGGQENAASREARVAWHPAFAAERLPAITLQEVEMKSFHLPVCKHV